MVGRVDGVGMHWIWAAFFLTFGVYLIARGRGIGSVRAAFNVVRVAPSGSGDNSEARLRNAIRRREAAEGTAAPIGWWGGAVSVLLGIIAALSSIADAVLYGILCLVLAAISAQYFVHIRNTQRTRVAALTVRTTQTVIPSYWFALAVATALSTLTYAEQPRWLLSSLLVCGSSLTTTYIAWRLTKLGSVLTGEDIRAEQIVDDRLRSHRTGIALTLALVQPFVFISQIVYHPAAWQLAAYVLTWIAWLSFWLWLMVSQRRPVSLA